MGQDIITKVKKQKSKYDKRTELVAILIIIFMLISGTFAWQAFSQRVVNETISEDTLDYELGGRLHDYYNGETKEVFVENYATKGIGENLYARIRLDEYYEYGEGAGTTTADTGKLTIVRGDKSNIPEGDTPSITKVETWDTYLWNSTAKSTTGTDGEDVFNIRTYRGLEFGGSTIYMPTFNKNINSLAPELNGTYAGPDGERDTDYDRYADYVQYTAGDKSDETQAQYADPDNKNSYLLEEDTSVHTARTTLASTVISMAEWMAPPYNSEPGAYWVYDVDGWAYWAQAITPRTATGTLLNKIVVVDSSVHSEWYYAVNVVAQLATAGDWGDAPETDVPLGTGMYEGGFTTNGQALLNKIAGITTE